LRSMVLKSLLGASAVLGAAKGIRRNTGPAADSLGR
jgi:hypothetical protein